MANRHHFRFDGQRLSFDWDAVPAALLIASALYPNSINERVWTADAMLVGRNISSGRGSTPIEAIQHAIESYMLEFQPLDVEQDECPR